MNGKLGWKFRIREMKLEFLNVYRKNKHNIEYVNQVFRKMKEIEEEEVKLIEIYKRQTGKIYWKHPECGNIFIPLERCSVPSFDGTKLYTRFIYKVGSKYIIIYSTMKYRGIYLSEMRYKTRYTRKSDGNVYIFFR